MEIAGAPSFCNVIPTITLPNCPLQDFLRLTLLSCPAWTCPSGSRLAVIWSNDTFTINVLASSDLVAGLPVVTFADSGNGFFRPKVAISEILEIALSPVLF